MEASGTVLRQMTRFSGATAHTRCSSRPSLTSQAHFPGVAQGTGSRAIRVSVRPRMVLGLMGSGFCDDGHLQYYQASSPRCGVGKEKHKNSTKKLKLLKVYSKGIFSEPSLLDKVSGRKAKQLEKQMAEGKEIKRKRKQEKHKLKASTKKTSSSSSESSDSDCGPKKATTLLVPLFYTLDQEWKNPNEKGTANRDASQKTIEVCMGNNCRRSGATELLGEFERRMIMGAKEGGVVGCKCMGKCKSGPNVRIKSSAGEGVSPSNPLHIGVGLEDVDAILANFLGKN